MFRHSSKERFTYLQQLVTEFQDTSSTEAKEQVLANLANFAYNPENFGHFQQLNVISLFLDQLQENNNNLVEYAIGGLCNLALDKQNKETILKKSGANKIINCLSSSSEEIVLSAITTLMFLITTDSRSDICTPSVTDCMLRYSKSPNHRLSNLATVFLQDYCTHQQINEAQAFAEAHQKQLETQADSTKLS